MAGNLGFRIKVLTTGNQLPEVEARLKDMRPVFDVIIDKWAAANADKFKAGMGMGISGAEADPGVFWKALTPGYWKAKQDAGFPDNLMIRTGKLKSALTDPQGFFRETSSQGAAFGVPRDEADAVKVAGNWERRQVIFLSVDDQRMIEKQVHDYLELGDNWQEIMFARGLEASNRRAQNAQMDMNFGNTVG